MAKVDFKIWRGDAKGGDGQMEVEKMPVVPQTDEQKQIIEDNQ